MLEIAEIAREISRSRFGGKFEIGGVEWDWQGSLSGAFEHGASGKGKIWCRRAECDLIVKIADASSVRRFALSKFAKNSEECAVKKLEFLAAIAKGLAMGIPTGDILKEFSGIALMKEIPLEDEPFNPNFGGYSWRHIAEDIPVKFGAYSELWQTAADKNRPTLKVRLYEKSEGEFYEVLTDETGETERKVGEQIDNRRDAFERLKKTMRECVLNAAKKRPQKPVD